MEKDKIKEWLPRLEELLLNSLSFSMFNHLYTYRDFRKTNGIDHIPNEFNYREHDDYVYVNNFTLICDNILEECKLSDLKDLKLSKKLLGYIQYYIQLIHRLYDEKTIKKIKKECSSYKLRQIVLKYICEVRGIGINENE